MNSRFVALAFASAGLVVVLAACSSPTTSAGGGGGGACMSLPASIDTATTLPAGCYAPTSDVSVNAALTLDPGVTIVMTQGSAFDVGNNSGNAGSLHAVGTKTQPIVFKGNGTKGYWGDVNIYSSDASNELTYVTVEDAGATGDGDVYVGSNASITITNSLIQNSGGYGIYLSDKTSGLPGFSSNVITGNALGAVYMLANQMALLDTASTYSGNNATNDWVEVDGGSVRSGVTVTWPAIDVPFFASNAIEVDGNVTVQPGLRMRFAAGSSLDVGNNLGNTGSLHAVGTVSKPIEFFGDSSQGYWGDINFYSASASNQLTNATVEGAGSVGDGDVYLGSNAQATVTQSALSDSGGWGICVTDTSATLHLDSPDSNTYTNDLLGPVNTPSNGC